MLNKAKNSPPGLAFVYDLPHHVIRKFAVFMDSTCSADPAIQSGAGGADRQPQEDDGGVNCGSFKAAEELVPVDPAVQATFDALYNVWLHNPQLANTGKATRVNPLPIDPGTHQPFDARTIAWDYPQGSYLRFKNYFQNAISTHSGANALVPFLGDDIHGWSVASVDVGVLISGPPGVTFSLSWDRSTSVHFEWCVPPDLDCIEMTITRSAGGDVSLVYEGVKDFNDNLYPSESGQTPGNLAAWHFRMGGGNHFADGMRMGGVYVPWGPACPYGTHLFLTITRQGSHIIGTNWQCVPNN